MNRAIKYSFVIPVKVINDYIRESVPKILAIDRNDFEIIIYPDEVTGERWQRTKQIASGLAGPATKRSLASRDASGEILIFIDDDAYPENNFLDILDNDFQEKEIVAVGGPAVTPVDDSFWQQVSGAVFLSRFSGSAPERYFPLGSRRYVDDWPSVNLSVRKHIFTKIGGFDSSYWPGEDTLLCLELSKRGKILYDPNLIAYHHRRPGLKRHLRQIGSYGLHRGYFAKKYPANSFKLKYFIPAGFFIFAFLGLSVYLFLPPALKTIYWLFWLVYAAALIFSLIAIYKRIKDIKVSLATAPYIFLTHLYYGWRFIKGFIFTRHLKSKLRE